MGGNFQLIWAVIGLPLIGFLLLAFFGSAIEKAAGRRALAFLSVLPILGSFVVTVLLTQGLSALDAAHRVQIVTGPPWIDLLNIKIPFEWTVDPLSMTMCLVITGIGALIFIYSTGYMAAEREYSRFFTYMNLFVAAMLVLVLGGNLPLLFVGWEGVGLCSYLLIGFWYKDLDNAKAANKAFIVNRIGDWGLTLGIFAVMVLVLLGKTPADGRLLSFDNFAVALHVAAMTHPGLCATAAVLLFIGAAGKSAQFPLYVWLPDAMAGPTPVSALIHAATMVTSGVVLLNRMHYVFEASPIVSALVCGIGAFTALFAALVAFGQTDIKKVLAYSTVSQLGYMFLGCGAGAYWAGMFHVVTHAFFKALLFLGAGAVIHAMSHNQDMRNYGGLKKYLPITTWTMVVAWFAISAIGIPGVFGFAGMYSKEAILGAALANQDANINGFNVAVVAGWVGILVALLTAAYMTRMMWLTFFGPQERWKQIPADEHAHHGQEEPTAEVVIPDDPNSFYLAAAPAGDDAHEHALEAAHVPKEVPASMWAPLAVLALLSIGGGFVLAKNDALQNWLAPISQTSLLTGGAEPESLPQLPWISVGAAVLGILAGIAYYRKGLPASEGFDDTKWSSQRLLARNQFDVDRGFMEAAIDGGRLVAVGLWHGIETHVVDGIVNGIAGLAAILGKDLSHITKGYVRAYALLMLLGGVGVLCIMFFGGMR